MRRINNWFEKKAMESLARKPWMETPYNRDIDHLKSKVKVLPMVRMIMFELNAVVIAMGILIALGSVSGTVIYMPALITGIAITFLGCLSFIHMGVLGTRAIIAHERMLAAYSEVGLDETL